VVIDDHESDIVEFKEAIMTNIDQSVPYVAANLVISPGSDGASLSWDHGKCIQGYTIKVCHMMETKDRKCYEEAVPILESHTNKITHTVRNLQSCSHYNLQILPMTEGTKLTAETRSFMTGSPPASPPQEVTVTLNGDTNKVDISWSKVECAHGYRIHQKLENSDTEIKWDSDGLSVSLESPEPCVTYSYGVSAIVGEQESVTTQLQQVHVPPRQGGNTQHPVLVIQEKVNGSVTFIIDTADINRRCKVGQYQVRSNSVDKMFDSGSLEGGRMTVEVPGEDTGPIQVRIHYTDFAIWSPWVSSASPRQEAFSMSGSMMVPLVSGCCICLALLSLISVLIVRRKKSQLKYDQEKAEGNTEESRKLKEATETEKGNSS